MFRPLLLLPLLAASVTAQTLVVDFPDSTLNTPQGQYPIYTGAGLSVIRGQTLCADTFVNLPAVPMICTRIGIQLAEPSTGPVIGPVTYTQFVMRAGVTTVGSALTSSFATNLPDQRVQLDLSGVPIATGQAVNQWIEFPLAYPFYFAPGNGVVIDFTTQASVAGAYMRTALSTTAPRCINLNYTGGGTGSASTNGGLKFRMVFEPLGLTQWGQGCPGTNNIIPAIGSTGVPRIGSQNFVVTLNQALPGTLCAILIGNNTNFDIGGGCRLYSDAAYAYLLMATSGTGSASLSVVIPGSATFIGLMVDVQWGVLDAASPSSYGASATPGGKVLLVQ